MHQQGALLKAPETVDCTLENCGGAFGAACALKQKADTMFAYAV